VKRIAISQSNYIPWKGYFDMIARVDEFVLYDDMQFTRRDWRNRNQIKTAQGLHWLTIPVQTKGHYFDAIKNIQVSDRDWAEKHWKTMHLSYARAPHFEEYGPKIASLYEAAAQETMLSRINHLFLLGLCQILQITTPLNWSMDYDLVGGKNERLINICRQAGATKYLSGPAAKDYLEEGAFWTAGLQVEWMDYRWYPVYDQRFGEFVHGVSVLDVIFNCGQKAAEYVWKRGD
jgi:WbqC-like protein family